MEQEKQEFLELIDRPAFLVRDGIVYACNQRAKNRQIAEGATISQLLGVNADAYEAFQGGVLYLTLDLRYGHCGATVTRQVSGDLFLLDRDSASEQLQALALAAQQLRIPLSNIVNTSDQLFTELDDAGQQDKAAHIRRGLFQLMRIIGNMADADRYSNSELSKMANTELGIFLQEIFAKANAHLESVGLQLDFIHPKTPVYTQIDRERMERAVMNLISNAAKFADGNHITAKLTCNGKHAALSLENEGNQIPGHVQSSLFQRYMREPAIEDSRFGLGLGFTLVRSVVAAHGGTILVDQPKGIRVTMTIAIQKNPGSMLRTPNLWIGDYAGGLDRILLELSDCLPADAYLTDL